MQATIRNDTPHLLELHGVEDRHLSLAPLEQRRLQDLSGFDLSEASRAAVVSYWEEPPSDVAEKIIGATIALAMVFAMVCATVANSGPWFGPEEGWPTKVWSTGGILLLIITAAQVMYRTKSFSLVLRFITQSLSLLGILAMGLGLPAATAFYFGDGRKLLESPSPELFVRLLQVAFIAIASLLPVLLYFLFDRYQLSTIRHRLYRDLFRLDRGLQTRSEIDARYGSQIREAYGPEEQGRGRLAPGTRWPVLVCAFVVTLGWLAAFRPVGSVNAEALVNPFLPTPNAWSFGFLGAYFFGLQLIARRYARGDLKPKAYGYITVRILTVAVLSWVLELIFADDSTVKLVVAFLLGILPDEFFTLLREQFRGRAPERLVPDSEKHPLTRLEGIDLYDRARLEQEGIVNVESLAHHELIHLVLETSIPVPRLVDWMDQAILYLHVVQDTDETARRKLRGFGIRTATDLLTCWDAADKRGELDGFKKILGGDAKPYRLEVIRDALLDDEWLNRVLDWRKDATPAKKVVAAGLRSFEARVQWAVSLEQQGRFRDAMQALEQALHDRDDAEARVQLARLYADAPVVSLRDVARSRDHAARAFELGSKHLGVLRMLVDIHEKNTDWAGALQACDAAIHVIGDPKSDRDKQKLLKALKTRRAGFADRLAAAQPQPPDIAAIVTETRTTTVAAIAPRDDN